MYKFLDFLDRSSRVIGAILGVASLIMLFFPAVTVADTQTTYSGLQVVFGYKDGETILKFSFLNLLTYLLIVVGIVFLIFNFINSTNYFLALYSAIAFIVAGILFFCTISFTMPEVAVMRETFSLGIGATLGGIFALIAGGAYLINALTIFMAMVLPIFLHR